MFQAITLEDTCTFVAFKFKSLFLSLSPSLVSNYPEGALAILRKIAKFKTRQYYFIFYAEALVIAKLKVHQCILMTDLPNLMLAKVSRYTVCTFIGTAVL